MNYVISYLIIVFSGFYLFNTPIKPVYILSLISYYLYLVFLLFKDKKKYIDKISIGSFIFIFYILITQLVKEIDIGVLFNILISFISMIILMQTLRNIKQEKIHKISYKFIDFTILLTLIDTINRFINSINMPNSDFYKFKFGSIMFLDSNFVGILIITTLFLCIYLQKYKIQNSNKRILILIILCILTYSRSAIISMSICMYIYFFLKLKEKKRIYKEIFFMYSVALVFIVNNIIFNYILNDGSFYSKFYIVDRSIEFLSNEATINQILFGVGVGNTAQVLGIGGHNILITYLIETGIIGLMMYGLVMFLILSATKMKAWIILLPNFIAGLSLSSLAMPFMYIPCVIIYMCEKNNYKINLE